jgi:transposase InsO family protein
VQSFEQSRRTYGCLRVRLDLQERGQRCGKHRLARPMRESGLRPRPKRRFRPRTTDRRHAHPIAENWLAKVPAPDRPGLIWQSDFTYRQTAEGWRFLACTLDACPRRCVAHHGRPDRRGELTTTTLARAVHRQPPPPGLLHHRERGVQYAAADFQDLATAHGITLSMSRPANPCDNALAESCVAPLKTECFGTAVPPSRAAAELLAFDSSATFYNRRRRHSSLGYLSPLDFENQMFPQNKKH